MLGGGVLGVELACGLRARGAQVTLVHHRDRLMERDLDAIGATRTGAMDRPVEPVTIESVTIER